MGCHSSKQARRDLLRSSSPLPRSKSLPDKDHAVSLNPSTLGSLNIDATEEEEQSNGDDDKNRDFFPELAEARAWSNMIDRKIPKTPTHTPPNEPELVDALELMAGLHGDYSPLDRRSFSFNPAARVPAHKSNLSNADPIMECNPIPDSPPCNGDAEFEEHSEQSIESNNIIVVAKKNNAVVLYFTSLRGIRKTYDDCCMVKSILREYNVQIDERDVSMHSVFKVELKEMSREGHCTLPRVLVDGRDLGGADEIKRLHEIGELAKVLQGCANAAMEKGETGDECQACGNVRFVLCGCCSGSCRVYVDEDDEEEVGEGGGWRRCLDCNENGIARCPVCCC